MISKRLFLAVSALALLASSGCASLKPQPHSQAKAEVRPAKSKELSSTEQPAPLRPFEGDTLYDLLLAEFAGKRNRADVALGKYLKQAHQTRDPQVAERAAFIARYMNAHQATLDASMLWSDIEPDNPVPREMAAIELIRLNQLDEAMEQIDLLLANNGRMNFEFLLQAARSSDRETRQQVRGKLVEYTSNINDAKLWFAIGALDAMDGNHEQAITHYDQALKLKPDYGNAILSRAQSLISLGHQDQAMSYLASQTSLYPQNKQLGVAYARYLIQNKQLKAAQQQFTRLSHAFPEDGDLVLSLALLSWENKMDEEAKEHFHHLIEMDHRTDEAHLYLARIAISEKDNDTAKTHFKQIEKGNNFATAQIQLAFLYQEMGDIDTALTTLDQAMEAAPKSRSDFILAKAEVLSKSDRLSDAIELLNRNLKETPEDTDLLYTRAMLKEQLDDFDGMEKDLRVVLEIQPNNSAALNALGYTFADRNQRLNEAWELIEKAYRINPDDPAIIDSMGWIKYRMGEINIALDYLRKAHSVIEDQEISAHFGEVLWINGQRDEAKTVWRNALNKYPDSQLLKDVMKRFLPAP